MSEDAGDEIIVGILRDILAELVKLGGAVDRLGIRVMAVMGVVQRAELHADDVAVDLAWAHQAAADVDVDAPAGARADAASLPTPGEKWENPNR